MTSNLQEGLSVRWFGPKPEGFDAVWRRAEDAGRDSSFPKIPEDRGTFSSAEDYLLGAMMNLLWWFGKEEGVDVRVEEAPFRLTFTPPM